MFKLNKAQGADRKVKSENFEIFLSFEPWIICIVKWDLMVG